MCYRKTVVFTLLLTSFYLIIITILLFLFPNVVFLPIISRIVLIFLFSVIFFILIHPAIRYDITIKTNTKRHERPRQIEIIYHYTTAETVCRKDNIMTALISIATILVSLAAAAHQGIEFDKEKRLIEEMPDLR